MGYKNWVYINGDDSLITTRVKLLWLLPLSIWKLGFAYFTTGESLFDEWWEDLKLAWYLGKHNG